MHQGLRGFSSGAKVLRLCFFHIQVNDLQKQLAVQIHKYEKLKNSIEDFQVKNNHDVLLSQKLKCTQHALQCKRNVKELVVFKSNSQVFHYFIPTYVVRTFIALKSNTVIVKFE